MLGSLPALVAFVVLLAGVVWALVEVQQRADKRLNEANVRSCMRVNVLRSVVDDFLIHAAQARAATGDPEVARQYRQLSERLHRVPLTRGSALVDCEAAFPNG